MFKNCFCILFLIFTYNLLIILLTIIIFYDIHISIFNFIKEKKKIFQNKCLSTHLDVWSDAMHFEKYFITFSDCSRNWLLEEFMFLTRIVALTSEVSLYWILWMRRSSSTKRTNHETFYIRKDDTWKCTG